MEIRPGLSAAPRCPDAGPVRSSVLRPSMKRSVEPSACRMAKERTNGRVRNVAAADVEQPADRIRKRDDGRVRLEFLELFGNAQTLGFGRFACERERMRHGFGERRAGLVGPNRVDGIGVAGNQTGAGLGGRCTQALHAARGMEPGIVADPRAAALRSGRSRPPVLRPQGRAVRTGACRSARGPGAYSGHRRRSRPCPSARPRRRPNR